MKIAMKYTELSFRCTFSKKQQVIWMVFHSFCVGMEWFWGTDLFWRLSLVSSIGFERSSSLL